MPENGRKIGWYLVRRRTEFVTQAVSLLTRPSQPELVHTYDVFAAHMNVVVASPTGGEAPLDPESIELYSSDASCVKFLENHGPVWKKTEKISNFVGRAREFKAIFYVGGHGRGRFHPFWFLRRLTTSSHV
jgi:putative intracellular protease/amidase